MAQLYQRLIRQHNLVHKTNQPQLAQEHCKTALQIAKELGIPLVKDCEELLLRIEEGE